MPENKDQKTSNTETFQAVHGIIMELKTHQYQIVLRFHTIITNDFENYFLYLKKNKQV